MIYRGLVITGTDTGVGKTTVAAALSVLLRGLGRKVGVLKPVETGCEGKDLAPMDGLKLCRAAGITLDFKGAPAPENPWTRASLEDVVPWRFPAALAPEEAAKAAGREIAVDRIFQTMDRWMDRADVVIVESAGGLMVPINPRFTFADLLVGLEVPALVVAPNRLGVINHVLLTLEALKARDITPTAVVLCALDKKTDPSAATNGEAIRGHGGAPVYEVPYAQKGADPANVAVQALGPRLDELWRSLEADWTRIALRYLRQGETKDQKGV